MNHGRGPARSVFTFGHGQPNFPGYVVAWTMTAGDSPRMLMFAVYGAKWAMEYRNEEDAGVERFNLPLIATLGRCQRCRFGAGIDGNVCGTCADDLRQERLADENDPARAER